MTAPVFEQQWPAFRIVSGAPTEMERETLFAASRILYRAYKQAMAQGQSNEWSYRDAVQLAKLRDALHDASWICDAVAQLDLREQDGGDA